MSTSDLQLLCNQRKWFDCAERIKAMIKDNTIEKHKQKVVEMLNTALSRMHPKSSSDVVVAFYPFLSIDEAIAILDTTEAVIQSQVSLPYQHINELTKVQMHICLCKIKKSELEDRESEILGWKKLYTGNQTDSTVILCRENYQLLDFIAYNFYSRVNNIEEAQKYLHSYISTSNDTALLDWLIKLSIASSVFFDFSSITTLSGFDHLQDNALKTLFISFQNGNFAEIDKNKEFIGKILNEVVGNNSVQEYMSVVVEKVYLVNVLNICFSLEHKAVPLDTLMEHLKVDEVYLIALLIKSLGIGIISGWIDSEKRILFFNGILPRSLSDKDILNMKKKFVVWKDKVARVIEAIENK